MSDVDYSKLKVTELREELKKNGLDTKGKKEQLVKRLENFFASGGADASLGENDADLSQSQSDAPSDLETSMAEESQPPAEAVEPASETLTEEPSDPVPAVDETPADVGGAPAEVTEASTEVTEAPEAVTEAPPAEVTEAPPAEVTEAPAEVTEIPAENLEQASEGVNGVTESEPMESEETVKEAEPAVKEEENTSTAAAGEQTKSVDAGEKRKRSRSPEGDRRRDSPSHKRERRDVSQSSMECRDWVESEDVQLDRYNCDLNLEVIHNGYTIKPQSFGGFGYMWGGLRANYGVTDGKVAFQMKAVKNLRIQIGEESYGANHVSRVGWSVDCADFQLGEYPKSWGYGGTAKFSTNSKFSDFNVKYYNTDVVTCYLDMTGDNVIMSFAKNDQPMAKAAEFPKSDLDGEALFPAIATKNQLVEVNFGQLEKPWVPLLGDEGEYTFIGKVPVEERVRAAKPPLSKEECEVLLLIGLPGAGKSHWAVRTQRELPEKRYYVLGTNNIIDRMKVEGVPRKNNYAGRWDVLFDQANDCLRKMLETATRRYKNYILDQTNVYDTAQRRKMRPFVGFKRKAVVVLPTDKVYRERITKRTKEEGKEVPETAVLEMKANFSLPTAPVETVLNPEANELAAKEAEEERLAKEKKQLEEKEAAAEKSEAAEKAEAGESEQVESAMEEGEEKKEEAEVKTEAAVPETKEEETEEKASADAVETEKPTQVKEEVEKMDETSSEQTAGAAESEPAAAEEKDTATESEKAAEGDSKPSADSKETEAKTEEKKEEPEQVFDEIMFTELSGTVARDLLAQYVKEGQAKFPPGSRRFRREDRRIERGGYHRGNDYRHHQHHYDNRDRRNNYGYNNRGGGGYGGSGGYGGGNRYGGSGGYNQNRGYDNRNRGGYGGGGGYKSGGYGGGYGGGWGGQGGGWNNRGGWSGGGGGNSWGGNYNSGGYGGGGRGGYGGSSHGSGGGHGNYGYGSGSGGSSSGNWGSGSGSSSSWNQGSGYGSGYNNYSSGGGGY